MNLLMPSNATEAWTVVLAIITAVYAFATFRILRANQAAVKAMHAQTEALLRPYVSAEVTARPGTTLMQLVVRNTGRSAAERLRMSIDRPLHQQLDGRNRNLQELPLFAGKDTMALAAGAELQHLIGIGHKLFNESGVYGMPESFVVTAQYSFGGRTYDERHTIDVRPLMHTSVVHDPIATAIKDSTERLVKALTSTNRGGSDELLES